MSLTPAILEQWLADGQEIALLDTREEGQFGVGHAFFATNLPYSRLELGARRLVPRLGTRVVLMGDPAVDRLARRRLEALGYSDVHEVDGGIAAWAAAGHRLFNSIYVPSKAFAECVEHACDTPHIDAIELQRLYDAGADLVVLDGRTVEEFERYHVPGAISCPNAELVYRFTDLVPSPDTLVVVSCAGRTRGIIGAQTLINAGVPNRVVSLAGGTQGWKLAGFSVEKGLTALSGPPTETAARAGRSRSRDMAERFGVPRVDLTQLERWRADPARTTYLLDVRTPEEFARGHLPGAVSIPGGQLIQSLDAWAATRGARLVLADDAGVRAVVTAHWLRQLGWDAAALEYDPAAATLEQGSAGQQGKPILDAEEIPAAAAKALLSQGAAAISTDPSAVYRDAHVEGVHWVSRARLAILPAEVGTAPVVLVFGRNAQISQLVAGDLQELRPGTSVRVVRGGAAEWRQAGLAVVATPDQPPDAERIDFLRWLHDRHTGNVEASRAYLAWEAELPDQVGSPEKAGFRIVTSGITQPRPAERA